MLLLIILGLILGIALVICVQGFAYWLLGSFVCWAFAIPYTFQFRHGLAIACIVSTIIGIVQKCKGGNDN